MPSRRDIRTGRTRGKIGSASQKGTRRRKKRGKGYAALAGALGGAMGGWGRKAVGKAPKKVRRGARATLASSGSGRKIRRKGRRVLRKVGRWARKIL